MSKLIANETQAFQVLNTFADSRATLIQGMKDAGYLTIEECEPIVIKWATLYKKMPRTLRPGAKDGN